MNKPVEAKNDKHIEQETTTSASPMPSTHHDTHADAVAHNARAHGEPPPQTFNDPSIQEDG